MNLLKKNKELVAFFLVICVTSTLSIINVNHTVTDVINIYENYKDLNLFDFKALGSSEKVNIESSKSSVKVSWQNLDEKVYLSSFDNAVTVAPSDEYRDICTIPEESKSLQLDVSIGGIYQPDTDKDFELHLYLITYNDQGQVVSKNKEVILDSTLERSRNHTLKVNIDEKSKKYKIVLRIAPIASKTSSGYFTLSNLDIVFK